MVRVDKYLFTAKHDSHKLQAEQLQTHMALQIRMETITAILILATPMVAHRARQPTRRRKRMAIMPSECFGLTVMVEFIAGHGGVYKNNETTGWNCAHALCDMIFMSNETLNLIFSFLGGGVVVAIFDWIRINKAEKISRRVDILNNQIRHLYGPLYFFTSQNEKCFALNDSILKAYRKEYVDVKFSDNPHTQENLRQRTTVTLDIANAYVNLSTQNNEKIIEILRDNYSFIDPEDVDLFQQFVIDYTRLKTELDDSGKLKTPLEIYERVGEISFMRPDFIERVKAKFNSKKKEMEKLNR